jgi:branched-subunit amino acid transport protein AzlD
MNSLQEVLVIVLAMGAVILFCRCFPFLLFRGDDSGEKNKAVGILLDFVEKIVPPAAMTVLAFNALGSALKENIRDGLFVLAASLFTAFLHLWKRNFLISILGGTVLYMVLS